MSAAIDPLSDLFSSLRLADAVSTRLEASAPWGWRAPAGDGRRITFVLVVDGAASLVTDSEPQPVPLAGGDVFVLFDSVGYTMYDDPGSALVDCSVVEQERERDLIRYGGGGALTTFLSGSFGLDELDARPILSVLPPTLHLPAGEGARGAIRAILDLLAAESSQPGLASGATVARLYELLFMHVVRAYAASGKALAGGWLAALADRQLAPAARAMHARPGDGWSLHSLADAAAMSRSAFASRFKAVVGQPPMDYLTAWRMHRAGVLIRRGRDSLAQVAQAVGYQSESAFNRVFKRATGLTPGQFRRRGALPA